MMPHKDWTACTTAAGQQARGSVLLPHAGHCHFDDFHYQTGCQNIPRRNGNLSDSELYQLQLKIAERIDRYAN